MKSMNGFKWHSPEILENYGLSKNDKFPRRATGQLWLLSFRSSTGSGGAPRHSAGLHIAQTSTTDTGVTVTTRSDRCRWCRCGRSEVLHDRQTFSCSTVRQSSSRTAVTSGSGQVWNQAVFFALIPARESRKPVFGEGNDREFSVETGNPEFSRSVTSCKQSHSNATYESTISTNVPQNPEITSKYNHWRLPGPSGITQCTKHGLNPL